MALPEVPDTSKPPTSPIKYDLGRDPEELLTLTLTLTLALALALMLNWTWRSPATAILRQGSRP